MLQAGRFSTDFAFPYIPEQEEFRKEAETWLQANVPEELKEPADQNHITREMYWWWCEKHKEMAAMPTLAPTPKEMAAMGARSPGMRPLMTCSTL